MNWIAAAVVAVAMSITWGDDQALQATADDLADAIQSAQASALAMDDE
ncbi:hypothetical protein QTH87_05885 [Variovorax sp. J22P168]|nr:hypothetical protein [Variovorax sp. J22P168]